MNCWLWLKSLEIMTPNEVNSSGRKITQIHSKVVGSDPTNGKGDFSFTNPSQFTSLLLHYNQRQQLPAPMLSLAQLYVGFTGQYTWWYVHRCSQRDVRKRRLCLSVISSVKRLCPFTFPHSFPTQFKCQTDTFLWFTFFHWHRPVELRMDNNNAFWCHHNARGLLAFMKY